MAEDAAELSASSPCDLEGASKERLRATVKDLTAMLSGDARCMPSEGTEALKGTLRKCARSSLAETRLRSDGRSSRQRQREERRTSSVTHGQGRTQRRRKKEAQRHVEELKVHLAQLVSTMTGTPKDMWGQEFRDDDCDMGEDEGVGMATHRRTRGGLLGGSSHSRTDGRSCARTRIRWKKKLPSHTHTGGAAYGNDARDAAGFGCEVSSASHTVVCSAHAEHAAAGVDREASCLKEVCRLCDNSGPLAQSQCAALNVAATESAGERTGTAFLGNATSRIRMTQASQNSIVAELAGGGAKV